MISARLKGGLGNILFEIAAVESMSIDTGYDSVFSRSLEGTIHGKIEDYENNILRNVNFNDNFNIFNVYVEAGFAFHPLPKGDNILYDGHFQSDMYFKHNKQHILNLFGPTDEFIGKERKKNVRIDQMCAIHVRRGDYLKFPDIHPTVDISYYNQAIEIIEDAGCTEFIVFSDDIDWCKNNFNDKKFTFIEGNKDWEDIWLMSLCKHSIMSNSSFSWWGSWLGQNVKQIVIAPRRWFGQQVNHDTSNLYAEGWTIL
jgi:hypothetical protein